MQDNSFIENLLPNDFIWDNYLDLNYDLIASGIKDKESAIFHYKKFGIIENRPYKKELIIPNKIYHNSSVFICGTSKKIEILENQNLIKKLEEKFLIITINSSFHYFNKISTAFLNPRFFSISDMQLKPKIIGEIFSSAHLKNIKNYKVKYYSIKTSTSEYSGEISFDLNKSLPHGPTTLLDIVFPFCVFNNVKNIYLFGLDYPKNESNYKRHKNENIYIERKGFAMNKKKEMNFAHKKLKLWSKIFDKNNINCYSLSDNDEIPFEKKNIFKII